MITKFVIREIVILLVVCMSACRSESSNLEDFLANQKEMFSSEFLMRLNKSDYERDSFVIIIDSLKSHIDSVLYLEDTNPYMYSYLDSLGVTSFDGKSYYLSILLYNYCKSSRLISLDSVLILKRVYDFANMEIKARYYNEIVKRNDKSCTVGDTLKTTLFFFNSKRDTMYIPRMIGEVPRASGLEDSLGVAFEGVILSKYYIDKWSNQPQNIVYTVYITDLKIPIVSDYYGLIMINDTISFHTALHFKQVECCCSNN